MYNFKLRFYEFLEAHCTGKRKEKYARKVRKHKDKGGPEIHGTDNVLEFFLEGKPVELAALGDIPNTNIKVNGSHNRIVLHLDDFMKGSAGLNLFIESDDNLVSFDEQVRGNWNLSLLGKGNVFTVGRETACGEFSATLHSNEVYVGHHCMISSAIELWTDGHSVIDNVTKKCLNVPNFPVRIGNHVWLGRRVTLTKGAQIPDDCIVGIGSIVTKAFTEPNCVIAGVPARVVKHGINWDGRRPVDYARDYANEKIGPYRESSALD